MSRDGTVKLGDLGVSKIVASKNDLHMTRVGTPLYLSPELVNNVPYDMKIDIWSIGCSLYHLAKFAPPFQGENLIRLGNNIVKTKHLSLKKFFYKKLLG